MKSVLLAFSGGLDTSFCAIWLKEQGYNVHTVTIDTGGFDEAELTRIESVAQACGVISHSTIDGRRYLYDRFLKYLVFGNVLRGQAYPLSVSAERVAQAILAVERAKELNVDAIAHGSTGAGNDQIRFDVAFRTLAPNLEVITPIRDLGLSREAETSYLLERGIQIPPKTTTYSFNEGMWGTSIGGRETLTPKNPLPDEIFPGGQVDKQLPDTNLTITFEKGEAKKIDGFEYEPVELIAKLNQLGQKFGIGRGHHLGDTILGIKGRIGFEAPAAYLLIQAHRELEKLVLSGKQLFWKESLGNLFGALLHEGQFFDPLGRDLEAFLISSQEFVTGSVNLRLRPYSFDVLGLDSPYSLMNPAIANYGEDNKLWNGKEAAGYAKVFAVGQILTAQARDSAL